MADQNTKLPDLDKIPKELANPDTGTGAPFINIPVGGGINTKEMVMAFGAVLVAVIIFFIIKNYVSKMLVANHKKSPRAADMAGWSLFCILLFATLAAVLGILDSTKFLSLPYLIPIGLATLSALIMFIVALVSKR